MKSNLDNSINLKNVAGVVVLYNPEDSVIQNIESYIRQVGVLYIVDNSTEPRIFIRDYLKDNKHLIYIFNNFNIGVAAALNIGAKRAISDGFSYLLTMDQDSKTPDNMVESLLEIFDSLENVGIVSPLHSNIFQTHKRFQAEKVTKVDGIMTSGNLISLGAYKVSGGFNEDFFIDYVDVEYCLRLKNNNYNIYRVNNVVLEHKEANLSKRKIFSFTFYPTNNVPFRLYYKTRNLLYLRKQYHQYSHLLFQEYLLYFKSILKILLFEEKKILKVKMILLGVKDYFRKIKGAKILNVG